MSEFMEKHAVSRIIGSPPGYVGYDEAGQLTEKVRRKPYSVILFDEIEKAHPDVLNILLQILDEGRVTDAHGRVVNFENTVIVMTSNAGSQLKENLMGFGKTESDAAKDRAIKALGDFLRPEFIGRVDEIVFFRPLSKENFVDIARLMLGELVDPLAERGITLTWTDAALTALAEKSHGGKRGARDLRNLIRREVENKIAETIVNRHNNPVTAVAIDATADGIVLNYV
jgi:ATP-dependent Clp protease ATP-binding subunit ClpA